MAKLEQLADFERLQPMLEKTCIKTANGPGGAPHRDAVLMFKLPRSNYLKR